MCGERKVHDRKWSIECLTKLVTAAAVSIHYQLSPVCTESVNNMSLDWSGLPPGIDPSAGRLKLARAVNKRRQVENLLACLRPLIQTGDTIVEFCGSSGYVVLPLAHMFPANNFVLVDKNKNGLDIGTP